MPVYDNKYVNLTSDISLPVRNDVSEQTLDVSLAASE